MLYKAFEFKADISKLDDGEFSGYASTFAPKVDTYGDIIQRGAFARTLPNFLENGLVLWQHQMRVPIGRPLEAYEDEKGLFVRAMISDTVAGRDCLTLMRDKVVKKLSIGFDSLGYQMLSESEARGILGTGYDAAFKALGWWAEGFRLLTDIELYEFSPVSLPANTDADILAVKNGGRLPETEREMERFLRDAGFSRTDAKAIVGHGFKQALQRDAGDHAGLAASIRELTAAMAS